MFFPEGTRSTSGEMQDFHNGAFKLALKKKVAVLPIAIRGTSTAMSKGKWLFNPGGAVSLTVLPALEPDDSFAGALEILKEAAWATIHNAVRES